MEAAYQDRALLSKAETRDAVEAVLAELDAGTLRVAERSPGGEWITHAWIKQAIILYFGVRSMQLIEVGPFEYHDKIPLKRGLDKAGVRVVPPGVVRYGAFLEPGAIVMPGVCEPRGSSRGEDDGRHLGHGRKLRPGGSRLPYCGRSRDWRRA